MMNSNFSNTPSIQNYLDQYVTDCLKCLGYNINEDVKSVTIIRHNRPGAGYRLIHSTSDVCIYKHDKSFLFYNKSLHEGTIHFQHV